MKNYRFSSKSGGGGGVGAEKLLWNEYEADEEWRLRLQRACVAQIDFALIDSNQSVRELRCQFFLQLPIFILCSSCNVWYSMVSFISV